MFHQSTNRNRGKGFKIKHIIQVALFLGVALWLVYQIKHSYDKKTEYDISDQKKLSPGVGDLYLGRKGNPGIENSVSVDSDGSDTAERNERKNIGQGEDNNINADLEVKTQDEASSTDSPSVVNAEAEAFNKGSQKSQEDSRVNADKQILPEKQVDKVDGDSNNKSEDDETKNDNVEGKEEVLQLPSQMDDDHSSGQTEDGKGETNSNEQTNLSAGNRIEQNSDPSKNVGEHGSSAKSASGEFSNASLDAQTSEGDAIRSQEGADNRKVDEVTNDSKQDFENANSVSDAQNNASLTEDEVGDDSKQDSENANSVSDVQNNASPTEDEVTSDSNPDAENANSISDAQNNASGTEGEVTNDSKPDAENANSVSDVQNNASQTEDEATNRDNAGQQKDGVTDKQNSDNQTSEVANTDNTKFEDDPDSSKPNPENNRVMPTNYEASMKDSFETQGNNASQAQTTDNSSSEETKDGRPDENSSSSYTQNNSEVSATERTEAINSQDSGASNAENQDKNADMTGNEKNGKDNDIPEPESETKSDPEISISSQIAHDTANTELKDSAEIESQLSNSNGPSTANSNAGNSASSSSSPEVSQPNKLKTPKATQKDRKKKKHHKQKEGF